MSAWLRDLLAGEVAQPFTCFVSFPFWLRAPIAENIATPHVSMSRIAARRGSVTGGTIVSVDT